ncbi:hypothetical protein [Kitasatospora cheerisanensis]|uniref:Uncharacterized protein n=1 Tax=Kitasatospora cheerisanensis KCTC 2395 TaxID=1348663 RepID=A0A066YP04_9ACTN|nr:hypothetical protein [Kitasatospora cheerisanensis]KDN83263.1 hypothetical protein KCH_47450 [Kitasatospora cheerisanensis KCTC 2395]
MADETLTSAPAAEHTAAPADPNSIEHALEVLAEQPVAAPVEEQIEKPVKPKDDETFEPLGTVINCP